ncbi:MAG: TetR/AcrR family transcriptional regulator, partial [Chloroflexota bacterium]
IQDIIDRANVGRSTFYAHYQDKEDLVNSNVTSILDELGQHLEDESDTEQSILPTLALFKHVEKEQHLFRAIRGGRGLELLLETAQSYWSNRIESHLEARLPNGQVPTVPLSMVANHLSTALATFIKWGMDNNLPYTPEEMDEMFHRLVMPGVWATIREHS